MFAFIDSSPWIDVVCVLVLGIWIGRRWAYTKLEAECRAKNCDTIKAMRTAAMKMSADKMSVERQFDFMRTQLREKDTTIHGLKSVNGKLGEQINSLTYQIPRQKRQMVA
jgi:hypothetical protein